MDKLRNWLGLHQTLRLLQIAAFIRNICQGIAVVDMSLYLEELGWSGGAVGGLLIAVGLFRSLVTSFAGELGALLGPKRYLLLFEGLTAAAAMVIALTSNGIALCAAVILAGFGMGHTGSSGPVTPIERAWIGAYARKNAERIFGVNALLGYLGMGIGSLFAGLTPILQHWLPGAHAYRPLFVLITLFTLVCMFVLLKITGGERKKPQALEAPKAGAAGSEPIASTTAKRSKQGGVAALLTLCAILLGISYPLSGHWMPAGSTLIPVIVFLLFLLATIVRASGRPREELLNLVSLINSIAVTLSSTMTSYWLSAKFGASPGMIGLVIAISYLMTGGVSLAAIYATKRFGAIKPIVYLQLAGVVCLLALPWSPWFWITAALNAGCTMFSLGTRGNRYTVMNVQRKRGTRTWQSRLTSLLLRLVAVLWPGVFGSMIASGEFVLPFYIAAAVQIASTLWYSSAQGSDMGREGEL
jgi:MFS family permease